MPPEDESEQSRILEFPSKHASKSPYTLTVRRTLKVHIRCIGGGGGGGGCSDRNGFGGGGSKGECTNKPMTLEPGDYLIVWGEGGAGGRATDESPPEKGHAGGETFVQRVDSGLKYAHAIGGKGGAVNIKKAKNGEDATDENGRTIAEAKGGLTGGWQESGTAGASPGAGGGGCGNQGGDLPKHGGRGGYGQVRIVPVG